MEVQVILLPSELSPSVGRASPIPLNNCAVAVFDVLRATTTMAAALAAGVSQIRIFADVASVRTAANQFSAIQSTLPAEVIAPLLCGEEQCLRPAGFDLGNSPGLLQHRLHAGRTVYMSTTNGTRAILASQSAAFCVVAALVNASAVARRLVGANRPITLLCSGTAGSVSMEDLLGCGAVIHSLRQIAASDVTLVHDTARIAERLFDDNRHRLSEVLSDSDGGRNVRAAGLDADITFASQLDAIDCVGVVEWTAATTEQPAFPVVRKA